MKNYIIIHRYKHGSDVYMGEAEHFPTEQQVIDTFDIDFEPASLAQIIMMPGAEEIEIFEAVPKPFKTIKQ